MALDQELLELSRKEPDLGALHSHCSKRLVLEQDFVQIFEVLWYGSTLQSIQFYLLELLLTLALTKRQNAKQKMGLVTTTTP